MRSSGSLGPPQPRRYNDRSRGPSSSKPSKPAVVVAPSDASRAASKPVIDRLSLNKPSTVLKKAHSNEVVISFPTRTLRLWNASMFVFHSALAVVTVALGNLDLAPEIFRTSLQFEIYDNETDTYVVRTDEDSSDVDAWRLVPYYEQRGGLPVVVLTALFFLLSAVFHLLNSTVLWSYYTHQLERCYTPTRWIEYTLSAPIMIVLIGYTVGLRSRADFISTACLVGTTMFFGYWVEREGRPASPSKWRQPFRTRIFPFLLGHLPQVAAWVIIILQFYDNGWDMGDVPWFVHLVVWGEMMLFFSFGAASLLSQWYEPKYFWRGELAFQVLSLVSKGLLGILLITNVLMLQRFDEIYEGRV